MGDLSQSSHWKKTFIVPAIKSFDHYDFNRAKIRASLKWLVAKAFGTESIPDKLKDPFYTDQYEQEHVKPPVVDLLLSAELYCRAGSLILKSDAAKPLLGHDAVIQALAQKGLYVTVHERLVTERDLSMRPIQMSAHLALIDTLMMAYTVETVSMDKVVVCMQQYSTDCADGDVPYDTEDGVISWMNKVNEYLKEIIIQEQSRREAQRAEPLEIPKSPTKWYMKLVPARYRKEQTLPKTVPWIPPVDNLLKDSTDGCALAALLHFYCPDLIKLEDVCLKESMSLADSLYNLQLVQDFCREHLNHCCHFSLEDMVYASSSIKNNYLVFMAELFWWFEVVKPSFVQPQVLVNDAPAPSLKNVPSVPISKVTKRSFMERPPSPNRPSLPLGQQPLASNSGEIRRSTSMSFVDSFLGTWPKERRSGTQGVSFDIPFDKDTTTQTTTQPKRGMTRSVSTEGFGLKVAKGMKRNLSFQPINGQNIGIEEEGCPDTLVEIQHGGLNGTTQTSIEEALEIIHNSEKQQEGTRVEAENEGFFLHMQTKGELTPKTQAEEGDSVSEAMCVSSASTTEVDTGIHVKTEDIQETLDEDSSLRDCTTSIELDADQCFEARASPCQDSISSYPSSVGTKSPIPDTPMGVKMTSFAEQKFKKLNPNAESKGGTSQGTTPDSSDLNLSHSVSWAPSPETSPAHQPQRDPAQAMAAEMVQLRMRLEEKRRAIEAQKKKVEAAFTRHRQKMGRSAFLTVVKRKNDSASPIQEYTTSSEGTKTLNDTVKSPEKSPVKSLGEESTSEADLLEYTRSIEKLNNSLSFLQAEMQRLAQQQEIIMQMREQQAWVVCPAQPSPQKQVRELRGSGTRSSGSPSPADSPHVTHRSPTNIKRKSASFHSKTPRTPRPTELKITPFNRVLTVPQSVDSIPRLRRFSPSQSVSSSFAYMGNDTKPSKNNMQAEPLCTEVAASDLTLPTKDTQQPETERDLAVSRNKELENTVEENGEMKAEGKPEGEIKPTVESSVSEVLSQAVKETFTVTPTEKPVDSVIQNNKNLIEVPLSILKPLDGQELEDAGESLTTGESLDDDQKMCCGFFFKDDMKGEDSMALKRAALLEKRQRRERENQQRKQQLEAEMEQKKEEARLKAEEDRLKKEEEKARREFIKQEYLRRKQLKLMEDMDMLVKARPAAAKQRKPRPKSIHRDVIESPKTPVRATAVSSISLASLNLGDNDSVSSDKRTPRSNSLASGSLYGFLSSPRVRRRSRPDSADSFLSPSRSGSHNGEKDWENASTTSSVTSITEYTGPKLYKEPSAKSNKHIIQNALAHCCLAGKVNEGQKNKILEEMEKSQANNFLILFRDSGCQFRAVYTYCPDTEQMNKLAGIGPKSITRKMIDGLFKYNSDRKQFSQIPAKTMSASVDAITIHSHLWQTKKPGTPKKVAPNKS
ncbi:calmodulin-regulated spectrin-associated protein 2a isoform X3 [Hemibagrus wyckioides]|uniref:calmodulin-regulated spectrin-associated protein 2a isoform X3 n=1 Tax=Hemibagrus wyckioides TaxID=337641 RepID=UPI00266C1E6A|nr:calmodulin-regulated spectrin-associated protein 2a isoform X3 [Hemibagrus wyckioides]